VFENRALRRIFGPKRDKIRRKCRKLHKEELNDLYSPNISRAITSRRMRWRGRGGVHIASMRERRGVYRVLVGKIKIHNCARSDYFPKKLHYSNNRTSLNKTKNTTQLKKMDISVYRFHVS
jgi:hypothetical protein